MDEMRTMAGTRAERLDTLSPGRRRLVRLMQRMNFGSIEDLTVRDGEPFFDPAPRILRSWKPGAGASPRPELELTMFTLKAPVAALFAELEAVGVGMVRSLEVRHGLPARMLVEEQALPAQG